MDGVAPLLTKIGFERLSIVKKEESKEYIKDWLPGSGCENYVVSAQISAFKPQDGVAPEKLFLEHLIAPAIAVDDGADEGC